MEYKGCVMEIRKDTMIVMTEDCTFQEIKKINNAREGMEIYFDPSQMIKHKKHIFPSIALIAASIILFIVSALYGINTWNMRFQPVALLTIDINPSIQIEINGRKEIVNITALNEDAEELPLDSLMRKPITEAIEELILLAKEKGYIYEDEENYILLTTVELKEQKIEKGELETLIEETKKRVEQKAVEEGNRIQIITLKSNQQTLKKAQKEGISVGKMEILQQIHEIGEEIQLQEMKEKKVKDLYNKVIQEKEHPVFEEHPGKGKDEKEHPVFEEHPGKGKDEKEHPVFEEHPGKGKGKNSGD